jgi:hypothetical protein
MIRPGNPAYGNSLFPPDQPALPASRLSNAVATSNLRSELIYLALAKRGPASAGGQQGTGTANRGENEDETIHNVVNASAAGDNILLAPPGGTIEIMEFFLWNASLAQTLILKDGAFITLLRITTMAPSTGFVLGYSQNDKPHFRVSSGNALILNMSVGAQVDGFLKYRTRN